ncbi:MAG: putative Ig domain-containing protein, partial [Methylococcaceae bacterium]
SYVVDNANSTVQALRLATDTVTDTFTYTVQDTAGLTSTATLTVTVQGADDAPVASNDTAIALASGATPGIDPTGNVLTNDTDVDHGDSLRVTGLTGGQTGQAIQGQYGSLTLNADGHYVYTLDNTLAGVQNLGGTNQTLTDHFTYTVSDQADKTATAALDITVQGSSRFPTEQTRQTVQLDQFSEFKSAALNQSVVSLSEPLAAGTADVAIVVSAVPSTGQLTLDNGTPVTVGMSLDSTQLAALQYLSVPGFNGSAGALVYQASTNKADAVRTVELNIKPVSYFSISSVEASVLEGSTGGKTQYAFNVQRGGDLSQVTTVSWQVDTGGSADASDFVGNTLPSGTVQFAAGDSAHTLNLPILADRVVENTETFTVRLTQINPAASATGLEIHTPVPAAQGTILDDDDTARILSVQAVGANGGTAPTQYATGDSLLFDVAFSRPVTAAVGTSLVLTLDTRDASGALVPTTRLATLISGSGTTTLHFAYVAQTEDADASGIALGGSLQGGGVVDTAGNAVSLDFTPSTLTGMEVNVNRGTGPAGATLYADANGNGQFDPGEVSTVVDAQGRYELLGGNGPLQVLSADSDALPLSAPAGASVVNPLTTLLADMAGGNTNPSTLENLQTALKTALGLADSVDLLHDNAVNQTTQSLAPIDSIVTGLKTYAAWAKISDLIYLGGNILTQSATGPLSPHQAGQAVITALSDYITAHPGETLDLTDSSLVATLIRNAATLRSDVDGVKVETLLTGTVSVLASSNQQLDAAATATNAAEAYDQLVVMAKIQTLAKAYDLKALAQNALSGVDPGTVAPIRLEIAAQTPDQSEGSSGTTPYIFTVTRNGNPELPLTVDYAVSGSVDAADFGGTLPAGTLSFGAGEVIKPFIVSVSGDVLEEPSETFTVSLHNASIPVSFNIQSADSLIRNDDPPTLEIHQPGLVPSIAGTATPIPGVSIGDGDRGNITLSVTLAPEKGQVTATGPAAISRDGDSLVLSGSFDNINTTLQSLAFTVDPGELAGKLLITTNDGDPTTDDPTSKLTVDGLYVTTIQLPDNPKVLAGGTTPVTGLSIADEENGRRGVPVTLTLTPTQGGITLTPYGGTTLTPQANGAVQLDGLVNDLNHTLSTLAFKADPQVSRATLHIDSDDHFNLTPNTSTTLNLAVLSSPTQSVPKGAVAVVNGVASTIAGLKVADYDSGRLQVTLAATGGTLELPQQTGVTVTSVDTHTWQLSGRPIDLNNSLAALRYTADLNLGSGTLRLATTDLDTLTQTARNDIKLVYQAAPTETLPTAITVLANTPTAVTGVQVADTDSATLTVTLNPTGGQIAIAESTGVTQARNDAGTVTLTGDINALNRALDTLSVTGQPGYFQVDVRVADNQPLTPDAVGTLNIAVLDSPHLILPSSTTVSSSTLTGVPGLQVVDGDSSAVTVLLAPTRGNLSLPDASGVTINPLTDGGLRLSGAPNALNNALFDLSFKATPGATDAHIDVTADDGDARTQNSTATVALSVAPERPPAAGGDLTLLALNGQAVLEDSIPTVANIRLAPTTLSDPVGGAPNRLVILDVVGGTLTQADGSPLVLGADGTVLSLDQGSLDLRFQPTAGRIEAATFRYALVDNVLDGLHSAVSQVTLPLTPINHAPVAAAALTDQTGIETVAFSYTVPTEAFKDSDAGDTLTLSAGLAGGQSLPDWLHFDPSTAQFSGTPDKTQAGTYPIQITATDAAGLSVHSAFNLVIADFIEPPTVELPPGFDTGEGANDGVTNQKVFSLQGKTQPGAQLVVLEPDHSTLDRVTADEAGAWQVLNIDTSTLVNDQGQRGQDGDYTFTVELLAEDQSVAAEKSFTLTLDTQAPTAPLGIQLTGAINTVGVPITNDSTPSFDITLANDPAADIKPGYVMKLISQDANGQESTVANAPLTAEDIAAGTINVTPLELADGTYSLVARLYDTAGNYQGELPLAFTIQTDQDGVLPSVESLVKGGDFNGDGIPDATQAQVTTLPITTAENFNAGVAAPPASFGSLIAGDLVTNTGEASGIASASIAIDPNAQLIGVKVLTPQDVENRYQPDVAAAINTALAGITVDPVMSGILDFTVQNKTGEAPLIDLDPSRSGLQTRVIIELPEGVKAHTYYKIGATLDNPTPHVYAYMADGNLSTFDDGAELFDQNGDGFIEQVVITFTDGGGGDDDLTANGQIVDPGFLGIETDAAQPGITLSGNTDPTQSPDDNLVGTEGSDTLQGLMGADTLSGLAGNDSLLGGEGHDALYGGDGDDTLDGGHGSDTRLDGEAGQDSILGDLGDDWLYGGDGNDTLDGGDGRDKLFGEDGDDLIRGDAKRDRMTGGAGNDTLEGGKGRDVYLYAATALGEDDLAPGTHDLIREIDARNLVRFSPEVRDVIKLDGQTLSSLKQDMPLGDTLDADHSIAYSTEPSSLLLDLDGNGVFEAD